MNDKKRMKDPHKKAKKIMKKLVKYSRKYSNCEKHRWLGYRCILCGIEVKFHLDSLTELENAIISLKTQKLLNEELIKK